MTTLENRKRFPKTTSDSSSDRSYSLSKDTLNADGSSNDDFVNANPTAANATPSKGRLEAQWEIEDGKLICKWIVV